MTRCARLYWGGFGKHNLSTLAEPDVHDSVVVQGCVERYGGSSSTSCGGDSSSSSSSSSSTWTE